MTDPVAAPTTAQLVAALAAGLLPLAGPTGIAVSALIPAVQELYDTLTAHPDKTFTVENLVQIIAVDNAAALAKLKADVDALPGG